MNSPYYTEENPHYQYVLGLGDDALILGQRWAEWLSKGPNLELDIASSNLSLDLFGQADLWLTYAAELEGQGKDSDDLAFLRDTVDFRNHWLVEQPNGDWGMTTARMVMFSIYQFIRYERLSKSSDVRIAEIASKAIKEVTYHRRFSSEWCMRLGQGTEESNRRLQTGFNELWRFVAELFETPAWERALAEDGLAVASEDLREEWDQAMHEIMDAAGVVRPETTGRVIGSRHNGHHSEHLGHLLCEMQFLQKSYPKSSGAVW
ncbi:phenylacetate-CoA oxygenase subunit PaaC [Temperatibacter marinus]|uniref:Phenylacetate-CoA oxygenase subunit PaaC n=1 Tax=Temperatibacter marinus TaxID=1456591 RepID=A0AA52EEW0_9PROT|nr:1,2-phenylacetyl-CoA epoxidase subunit PaaC [Temperatibacter marinus]WND01540.1 phenylacetate-CoA oxygenase subunit PaaC [Temperatibacter marinus]